MGQRITQVDAFTSEKYCGNPAAICVLEAEADAEWMQRIASEMNLSETAYVTPYRDGFGLRWFTPAVEVDLCGHATVAAAHVLWEEGVVGPSSECRFHTRSGVLVARRGESNRIDVDFGVEAVEPHDIPQGANQALGAEATSAAFNRRLGYIVLELGSEAEVRAAQPDFSALAKLPYEGIVITGRANPNSKYAVVSRFFAPRKGVNEDPATGSAHCVLATYWSERLGNTRFEAHQASARGADIQVTLGDDRVTLGGHAVTVLRGELV